MRITPKETTAKNVELRKCASMWKRTSKKETTYLSGEVEAGVKIYLTGFFRGKKVNPKQPDIEIYLSEELESKEKEAVITLWKSQSKNGKIYYTGKTSENEKLVAFENNSDHEKAPFLNIFYKEDSNDSTKPDGEELPF